MSEDFSQQTETAKCRQKKTIEERYQKKTLREHVLTRPDSYVGSCDKREQEMWVHNGTEMVYKTVNIAPALYKIFDEILVNAADNKVNDPTMSEIRVFIDVASCKISIWNNGDGIPVEIHQEHNVYVPEMIFGQLLTSDNYDDAEAKITGGRNGYGAKLTNIYSKTFTIETCDGVRMKKYKQTFSNNMTSRTQPVIVDIKKKDSWTKVTFEPDLSRFKMTELEDDVVSLMRRRVYDMAGILGESRLKVTLNGQKIKVKNFQEYVDLYLGPKTADSPRVYEKFNNRWEICIAPTDGQFQQVTFVNAICTSKGGKHVDYIVKQLAEKLVTDVEKKTKTSGAIKAHHVRSHLSLFINCQIRNPEFDSQTKENMVSNISSFGSKCSITDEFIKRVKKSGVMDKLLAVAELRGQQQLKKGDGKKRSRLTDIPKLEDANDAGSSKSQNCTLILTEGDSAKALAVGGLGVVGRNSYGVFPLRGKLLNVRDATAGNVSKNEEIKNIKKILGLQHGMTYDSTRELRYGHLMIMADQDHDGSHIKGLIMNFMHKFYPSLLKIRGFLQLFVTPVIKATKGTEEVAFYTLTDYHRWKETVDIRKWRVGYYKGLGSSTAKEGKEYFADLSKNQKFLIHSGPICDDAIDKAFSKSRAEDRKQWLEDFVPGTVLDHAQQEFTYSEFVDKELIHFSRADVERSIPNIMDGLKPGQRKIMFCCFKRNLKASGPAVRVSQLSGYVSEHSAYHHGEQSLQSTIVGLAQDYWGSNNISLLYPQGQFGTRLQGGKDCASARYISTKLASITRDMFHADDEANLKFMEEEGQSIEPKWYAPVVPLVLMNGAEGIGTGWSTLVPCFNPRDIVANIKRMLDGLEPLKMSPWYKGFKGTIERGEGSNDYTVAGLISRNENDDNMLEVTELPIKRWTQTYKEFLMGLLNPERAQPFLTDFKEYHTESTVHFELHITPEKMMDLQQTSSFYKTFDLKTKMKTSNMVLFDPNGKVVKYASAEDILKDYFKVRLELYTQRKASLLQASRWLLKKLSNKIRFIRAVLADELIIRNRHKAAVVESLERDGYDRLTSEGESDTGKASYDYLLGMSYWTSTIEEVKELEKQVEKQEAKVQWLQQVSEKELWISDMDNFLKSYSKMEEEEAAERDKELAQLAASRSFGGARRGRGGRARSQGGRKAIRAASEATGSIMPQSEALRSRGGGGNAARGRKRKRLAAVSEKDASTAQLGDALAARLERKMEGAMSGAVSSRMDVDLGDIAEYVDKAVSSDDDHDEVTSPLPSNLVAVAQGKTTKRKANLILSSSEDTKREETRKGKAPRMASHQTGKESMQTAPDDDVKEQQPQKRARRPVAKKTYIDLRSDEESEEEEMQSESEYVGSDSSGNHSL